MPKPAQNNKFDKKMLANLLKKAQGNRTLRQFALAADIDSGYLSRLINMKRGTPPSPEILKKLAKVSHNGITYEQLLFAAGYIESEIEENFEEVFRFLDEFVEEMKKRGYDYSNKTREELADLLVKLLKASDILRDI